MDFLPQFLASVNIYVKVICGCTLLIFLGCIISSGTSGLFHKCMFTCRGKCQDVCQSDRTYITYRCKMWHLAVSFEYQRVSIKLSWSIVYFMVPALHVLSAKSWPVLRSERLSATFYLSRFIVSSLRLGYLINFQLISLCGMKRNG